MYYKLVLYETDTDKVLDEWNLVLPALVGRAPDCPIQLNDPSISRQHCKFGVNPHGAVTIQDVGSTNGVYVRDVRVKQDTIVCGERFQIGSLQVSVESIDAPLEDKTRDQADDSMYSTQKVDVYEID